MNHDNHMGRTRSQAVAQQTHTRSEEHPGVALPVGTHLGEFEILGLIGEGGFGIVYLAYDHSLNRRVALKEYMPSGLVERNAKMAVTVKSQRNSHAFSVGLKSFVNEARMLAQFDSPALVKVHRFWEENGTAYMVMPYYDGVTLRQAVKEHRIKPNESWIRLLLSDLCDAIETIHRAQCFHRDIAPDNILLLKDGRPLLLDFGAARMVIGDLTQCLTVILKPGYAPIEQYAENGGLRQGPWTDIYALAGVVYYLITGMAPPPSVARIVHDELVPARIAGKDRYSANFLAVIDKALAVKPEHRFQSIAELRHSLDLMETIPRSMPPTRSQRHQEDEATRRIDATVPTGNARHASQAGTRLRSDMHEPYGKTASVSPLQRVAARMHAATGSWPKWIAAGSVLVAGLASGLYFGNSETVMSPLALSDKSSVQDSSGGSGVTEEEAPKPAAPAPTAARKASVQGQVRQAASVPSSAPDRPAAVPRGDEPQAAEPAASKTVPAPSRSSSEEKLWRRTVVADNAIDYDNYLREYPQGQYAAIARRKLDSMQAAAAPAPVPEQRPRAVDTKAAETKAVESKSIESKAAASRTPDNRNEDNVASENAAAASTGATQSPWAAESKMWDMATAINQGPAYESYLRKYPQGRFAALARDKLAAVKPSTPAAEQAPAESPAPAPAAKAREPAQSAAVNNEPRMPERQANLKPLSPSAPAARTDTRTEARTESRTESDSETKSTSESPAAGRKTMKAGDQTLIGDFVSDPVTGILSGTGRIIWPDGNRFEGTLVKGVKEGKGKFTWHNGQRYTGDWSKDAPNGKGTIEYANGIRYQGDVRDGMPHGQGTLWFRDGDVYKGAWVQGRSHGQGRYTWANGSYWEGEFRDDKRTENGKMVFADKADSSTQARN